MSTQSATRASRASSGGDIDGQRSKGGSTCDAAKLNPRAASTFGASARSSRPPSFAHQTSRCAQTSGVAHGRGTARTHRWRAATSIGSSWSSSIPAGCSLWKPGSALAGSAKNVLQARVSVESVRGSQATTRVGGSCVSTPAATSPPPAVALPVVLAAVIAQAAAAAVAARSEPADPAVT